MTAKAVLGSGTPPPSAPVPPAPVSAPTPSPAPPPNPPQPLSPVPSGIVSAQTIRETPVTPPPSQANAPIVLPGYLEFLSGSQQGARITIVGLPTPQGAEATIGREHTSGRHQAHILVPDPTVSRQQARLLFQNGHYQLVNLSSTNPTQVNGRMLDVEEGVFLASGDRIRFGDVEAQLVI